MQMNSLDPRVNRLPLPRDANAADSKEPLDQFGTYEVFVQPKEGKSFQHEGIVHAPNLDMAFVLAKESFTRRFLCVSLCVAETGHVFVSPTSEGSQDVFDLLMAPAGREDTESSDELYILPKRGKQHVHAGQVMAANPVMAMVAMRDTWSGKGVCNIWAIQTSDIRFTSGDENELWRTLPDKKFRDAADYRGGDKLKEFLEKNKNVRV